MARWKLIVPHYLFGYPPDLAEEGVEWEYKETDRISGRERRKRFKVPFYMDEGSIVCHEGRGLDTDTVFVGSPTHDMLPLDEEARRITASLPAAMSFDDFFGAQGETGFSAHILSAIEKQIGQLDKKLGGTPIQVTESGVSRNEFEALQKQMADLMAQNMKLQEMLISKAAPEQVIDDLEPLPPDGVVEPVSQPKPEPVHRRSLR